MYGFTGKFHTFHIIECFTKGFKNIVAITMEMTLLPVYCYTLSLYLQDIQANEARIADINTLAKKLLDERHPDSDLIRTRQEGVNESWADLRAVAKHRKEKLAGAHEIQKFNRLGKLTMAQGTNRFRPQVLHKVSLLQFLFFSEMPTRQRAG